MNVSNESVLVAGGGIAGMFTALALEAKGFSVTLLDKDGPPPDGNQDAFFEWQRQGAAQFNHPHAFLGLLCNLIKDNYPDLMQRLMDAGARPMYFEQLIPSALLAVYEPEPEDDRIWLLLCRRSTLEVVLRQYVQEKTSIRFINQAKILDIKTVNRKNNLHIDSLHIELAGEAQDIRADIYIDASGRTSPFPRWFARQGVTIPEESEDAGLVYYTRYYRLNEGMEEPPRDPTTRAAGDLGYIKYGVFPADDGYFAVILCVPVEERELIRAVREPEGFQRIAFSIPGITAWLSDGRSRPVTESFGIGDIKAVWRKYVTNDCPLFTNYFAVGDAYMRTNPLYGRGCSTSALQASLLAEVLRETSDPLRRGLSYEQRNREYLWPIYETSLMDDRNGRRRAQAVLTGRHRVSGGSAREIVMSAFRDAVSAAARKNLRVVRGALRTFNLVEKPGAFLKDWLTLLIVLAFLLKGSRKNLRDRMPAGPSREETLRLVSKL